MKKLLQKLLRIKPTKKTPSPKVTYKVMLRDYFEGEWADLGKEDYTFEEKGEALKRRDELNLREFKTVTPSYDHYGVVEMTGKEMGKEIECPATFRSQ